MFDGIIIIASFTLDLVFVEGVSGEQGEEAIALLIIFLLWRILRVVNGEEETEDAALWPSAGIQLTCSTAS